MNSIRVLKKSFVLLNFLCIACSPKLTPDFLSATTNTTPNTSLDIYVIGVGQGDATLVLGPSENGHRTSLLIDAGPLDPDAGERLLEFFDELAMTQLDHLVLTHFDADHMGGFVTTYASTSILWDEYCAPTIYFPTQSIIDLGTTDKETDSTQEYLACREANEHLLDTGHAVIGETGQTNMGFSIDLGGDNEATIVAGNGYVIGNETPLENVDTENERSLAVLVSGPNNFNFLVMGDLPGDDEQTTNMEIPLAEALQQQNVDITILRAGHHGSAASSSAGFLEIVQPETSIISVGSNNYGHPTCTALENLFLYSADVYQTEMGSPTTACAEQNEATIMNGTIWVHVENGTTEINQVE